VRRGDFHAAGPEVFVNVFVCDDGDLASGQWQDEHFANEAGVAFILWVDGNGDVSLKWGDFTMRNEVELFITAEGAGDNLITITFADAGFGAEDYALEVRLTVTE